MRKFLCIRNILLSCLACSLILAPMVGQAVTLDYAGTVTYIFDPNSDLSNFGITLGDAFSVHIEFDETASPDAVVTGVEKSTANYNNIISEFRITSGSYTAYASAGEALVNDAFVSTGNVFTDDYISFSALHTSTPSPNPGVNDSFIEMMFYGNYETFSGTSLDPVSPPVTVPFDIIAASIAFDSNDSQLQILSEDLRAVPEPTTMLLFGAGLVGLAGFRRKFKS